MPGHVHKEVAAVAREAAAELYETVMADNLVRAEWKRQNPGADEATLLARFVERNWGKCIPFARATMARLLTTNLDTATKDRIMKALSLDSSLMRGRKRVGEGARIVKETSNA